jgi:hypothetical protein
MKTMHSKFPGTCARCSQPIQRGELINFYGRGHAEHAHHTTEATPAATVGPCWICQDPAGKFRNLGAATPVWCDTCHATQIAKTRTVCNVRFTPDRFDMQVEDNMRDACGC